MKALNTALALKLPLLFVACLILFAACRHVSRRNTRNLIRTKEELFSTDDARSALAAAFPVRDTMKVPAGVPAAMAYVYAKSDYLPLWVTEQGLTDAAQQLLSDLDSMRGDAINPERYNLSALRTSFKSIQSKSDLGKVIAFDTTCTRAYLQASHDLLFGLLMPRRADSLWHHSNDSSWKAPQMLVAMGIGDSYPGLDSFRSAIPTYAMLRSEYARYSNLSSDTELTRLQQRLNARAGDSIICLIAQKEVPWIRPQEEDSLPPAMQIVRAYQEYFGINPTGKADTGTLHLLGQSPAAIAARIGANMERLRWMPRTLESRYVLVDVPLMELYFRKDGYDALRMRVVVGRPARQTPVLNAMLANIVFSPSWGVPPTILKKDVLPGLSKSGARYLSRKGLRVYTRHGKPVNAAQVNAGNIRGYVLRQPPGEDNALGDIKFNLPNPWDIYLHDTPHRSDFAKRYRAKSSGCIRVEKPREFAEFILRDIEGRDRFDQTTIDSIIQTRKTRWEILKTKIPVHIVYLTALEDSTGNHVRLVQDIYGRDGKLMEMLSTQ
jgi:murein L,D-transpeptidase YcbB/YkuD